MASAFKQFLHDLSPPVVVRGLRKLRGKPGGGRPAPGAGRPEWEHLPDGWRTPEQDPLIKGWNVPEVLEAYRARWDDFLRTTNETRPFGLSPEAPAGSAAADIVHHNAVMIFGYCLTRSAIGLEKISMLDWGGGLGHYYLIARALLPRFQIDYHCKDVPVLAEHGRTLLPDAQFHAGDDCLLRKYDFVMASTSMHYSRDWRAMLKGLAGAADRFLLVTGLPVVFNVPSFVFIQRPYAYGYNTEYVSWCLNREQFLLAASEIGLVLDREFIVGYQPAIAGAPEQCQYRGYLFRAAGGTDGRES